MKPIVIDTRSNQYDIIFLILLSANISVLLLAWVTEEYLHLNSNIIISPILVLYFIFLFLIILILLRSESSSYCSKLVINEDHICALYKQGKAKISNIIAVKKTDIDSFDVMVNVEKKVVVVTEINIKTKDGNTINLLKNTLNSCRFIFELLKHKNAIPNFNCNVTGNNKRKIDAIYKHKAES